MAFGQHRAGYSPAFRNQVAEEGSDSCQPAVDGTGLESLPGLGIDKVVHIPRMEVFYHSIPHHRYEQCQVTPVIPPGFGLWAAHSDPVNERFDFGEHPCLPWIGVKSAAARR
jgi:hypothetical protein